MKPLIPEVFFTEKFLIVISIKNKNRNIMIFYFLFN